jgi:hypothetical protein
MPTASQLRSNQASLAGLASNDLMALWRQVSNAAEARVALFDVLPKLIQTYGSAAASLAADWYDEARAEVDIKGAFRAIPADLGDQNSESLIAWATDRGTDLDSVLILVNGGVQKRIAMFSRLTVASSSIADPQAHGWQREGAGECDWCSMLISRGAVYSEATADFAAHDHDECVAVPAFVGHPKPVKPYTPSLRQSKATQASAKRWISDHL